ncbi:MAG: DNA-directed RNA polymerase subunit beta [Stygiobacter sp. RIFOXYC2_FULL_38_25]|nr:MAG: DNA-directed RNA polymerase beta [Ignavibacteria bacterium]OGV08926.1 MAG: DNA-directed RNA polymerase subunit beta [Stygiobacter sp. RIFOXYB2_FULL_37_11]OGV15849.1 MAG: DNA-directed RNA polymerase subunit beta [Stygiobacter sp. RIFOXYC2_FULL_38_25]OGV16513.1 MAG: DNA-directed RNA polymerase subunit beta [Stygiobacter sp. RIFOXYA2_FULL_38_8]OGV80978.1 MAG: DNA-directed RNA polymerase subunit beta [Stygiobacter sp. GWF2_38_21]
MPDLLNIQVDSFEDFLQLRIPAAQRENKGLQTVFNANFPIHDNKEFYRLDFVEYYVEKPRFSIAECEERGLSYSAPLKAKLRLSTKDDETGEYVNSVEQEVYLGNLPFMTERGTFIINGAERVVVTQLHRSPGVAFAQTFHPNGTPIYSARIIPFRGSWVEFATDINNVMYVYIDRRKKFPSTTLLRALGYETDDSILRLFDLIEEVSMKQLSIDKHVGRIAAADIIDTETGEIYATKDAELTEEILESIKGSHIQKVQLISIETSVDQDLVLNTLKKDTSTTKDEALFAIYRQLRSGEAPDIETAVGLIDKMFFNDKRYDLGEVGRFRMNDKLNLSVDENIRVLTPEDIIAIMKNIIMLKNGNMAVDDIDHLGNRRVRTVGEQLQSQYNVGLARMARTIKERMNMRDNENMQPQDLVNARTISSVINAFFGTNQLSQFMDQTNPLSELTHKRRISALGPGGLTRERAGFEVRDVHHSHYGRLCPIETPEGPNIGLISSLTIYTRVNNYGFLETPYRKVKDGRVTNSVDYLSADQEDEFIIAQSNVPYDDQGRFIEDRVKCRERGEFPVAHPGDVHYMDVAPAQIVSAAAALIPFLEHDDANRALMGSNMQRQAVPLMVPENPIVGTGMEAKIARDSRAIVIAAENGIVEYSDAKKIIVKYDVDVNDPETLVSFNDEKRVEYTLTKFSGTNQETCFTQKPIVVTGQRLKKGDVLADGSAIEKGELGLGRNVSVAFMPWRGYNFEDAIVLSEKLVADDVFTSIHIEEFELQVRETRRGEEELTRDIPNVSEEATKDLDENGIVREGAEVKEGDILIGKITPKGETDPTPEEKLLKAIFGDKAGDVKDASLKAPPGLKGVVIKTRLFSRKKKDTESKKFEKKLLDNLDASFKSRKENHYAKLVTKLTKITEGKTSSGVRDLDGSVVLRSGTLIKEETFANIEDITKLDYTRDWFEKKPINEMIKKLYSNYFNLLSEIEEDYKREKLKIASGDELPPGITQLAKVYVAKKRKIQVGDKMAGRHGNKGVVAKVVPVEDMPYHEDGTPVDIVLNPLGVPSRMNLGQLYETVLGWVGKKMGVKFETPIFDGAHVEDVEGYLKQAGLPDGGKAWLTDGRSGEKFHQKVTCGYIYMMKLGHMVDDKIHARSIGPYSLITQQPLGGKAQFGGQRFGEMEVWALEGYGAAHVLQEILTVKSDDVTGRAKTYEAIVKGENIPEPNIPEAFNVMIKELQGLGLDIKVN